MKSPCWLLAATPLAGCATGRPGTPKPAAPEPARVAPRRTINRVDTVGVWSPDPKKRYSLQVVRAKPAEDIGWPSDWFELRVLSEKGQQLAARKFHSSYEVFQIDAIDLTGDGSDEFVFLTGFGRGTSVRKETLAVYRREGAALAPILEVPLSAYFDSGRRWWYKPEYLDLDGNGTTDLRLVLTHDAPTVHWKGWRKHMEKTIPRAAIKEYRWDPTSKKMLLHRQVPRKPFGRPRRAAR